MDKIINKDINIKTSQEEALRILLAKGLSYKELLSISRKYFVSAEIIRKYIIKRERRLWKN